jgi:3-hydroxybutyryl-CoA dehydrogenase
VLYNSFGQPKYAPNPLLKNMVLSKNLGAKTQKGFYIWGENRKIKSVSPEFLG